MAETEVIYDKKHPSPRRLRQHQRHRYIIVKEIFSIVSNIQPIYRSQRRQTSVGYAANLTHPQTVRYLRGLLNEGLLILTKSRPYPYYEIAPKGQRCLWVFSEIEDKLCPSKPLKKKSLGH
jgi:predicted transcriptional regulator